MILPAPMLLHEGRQPPPFGQPGWSYELKFDGYRVVAGTFGDDVELRTRNGADASGWFPEIVRGLRNLRGGPNVLDGEVCVLDDIGRSDFERLQARARRRRWYPGCDLVVFCAFDLLARDGASLIGLPMEERKRQLKEVLTPLPPHVLGVGQFEAEHGPALMERAKELRLEGLVAKRLGSLYTPGQRTRDWVKIKRSGWQEGRSWRS